MSSVALCVMVSELGTVQAYEEPESCDGVRRPRHAVC